MRGNVADLTDILAYLRIDIYELTPDQVAWLSPISLFMGNRAIQPP